MHCFSRCESQPRRQENAEQDLAFIKFSSLSPKPIALVLNYQKKNAWHLSRINQVLFCHVSQLGVNKGFTLYTEQHETVRRDHEKKTMRQCHWSRTSALTGG